MKMMRSLLTALILVTSVTPALAGDSVTPALASNSVTPAQASNSVTTAQASNDSNSATAEIRARWEDRARDARRRQMLQGLAIIGGSVAGGYLVGRAIDIGSGPRLTPWTTLAGAGVGAWLAVDVISWRTFRGQASAAPTRGGARAAMAFRW
ncbi:MAG: hypothetical protein OXF98_10310 [Rhodospirillaceae bacterium]|nr:hypothetical protein [Rhodospirillaceae bacterium]